MKKFIVATVFATASLTALTAFPGQAIAAEHVAEAGEVTNERMVEYYRSGMIGKKLWVIDSRPEKKYITGHIPGAINLPLDVLKKDATVVEKLAIPKTDKVIFYCAGRECTLSVDSAQIFIKLGYAGSEVYRNGVPGWNQKMQPLLAEEPFLKKGNVILIDTVVGKETIVTASNKTIQISMDDLKGDKGKSLLANVSKNAPMVVIERGNMDTVNATLEELRDLDFRRLSYFPVMFWKEKLAVAPAITTVTWAPVYDPGQISPKSFEAAVSSGQFILDVRPAADYARGHFKGAVNIPIENLEKDYAKINRESQVFINCATGAKSQKAFDILSRKGYSNLKYLDAEISCKGETCTIKE
ncbi:MAG: rhodanese-like domain-containing protein [Desulfuromonadaceae bacterium]|nr:rhodanese-like domain-containing protein [Desulfuromonadaceae bacterium]